MVSPGNSRERNSIPPASHGCLPCQEFEGALKLNQATNVLQKKGLHESLLPPCAQVAT